MMRKFKVFVNGEAFEVEIEEVGGSAPAAHSATPDSEEPKAAPKANVSRESAPPKPATTKAVATGAANEVTSPLPGTVIRVIGQEGQTVAPGELVMIVEAMKMENEIVAPKEGKIKTINVRNGDSVQTGDVLFTLE